MRWLVSLGFALLLTMVMAATALAATPDGKTPGTAMPVTDKVTGTITGSTGGSFNYYTITNYPGDGSNVTVKFWLNTYNIGVAKTVFVKAWQDGKAVASMDLWGAKPGYDAMTFSSKSKSPILLEVSSWRPGIGADYYFETTGLPAAAPVVTVVPATTAAPAAPAKPATTTVVVPAAAPAAAPAKPVMSINGTIMGSSGGAFNYYTLTGAPAGKPVTLKFWLDTYNIGVAKTVFVKVWQDGKAIASMDLWGAKPGYDAITFTPSASPITIEVSSWRSGIGGSYYFEVNGGSLAAK